MNEHICDGHPVSIRTEILAGVTTFLSMAYVLALYPNIMSKIGLPPGGAMIAAALASAMGTFLMGLLAKYPFALAPDVGLIPFLRLFGGDRHENILAVRHDGGFSSRG